MIATEIDNANLTFCCMQEVRYRNTGKKIIRLKNGAKYVFIWSGNKKRRDAGVGFLIKDHPKIEISEPEVSNSRITAINMTIFGFKVRVVNAYSPTNIDGSENQKRDFYRLLQRTCTKTETNRKLIVAGDFNAQTSLVYKMCYFDGNKIIQDHNCNDNGERMKSFCRFNKFCMTQTFFDHPVEDRITWHSNDGKTKRIIDYVFLESFIQQYVTDCKVENSFDVDSDHRILITNLKTPTTKKTRWKEREEKKKVYIPDTQALNDEDIRTQFNDHAAAKLNDAAIIESTIELDDNLISALSSAAESTLPSKVKTRVRETWSEDDEFNTLLQQRKNYSFGSEDYKDLSKRIKKRIRHLRNEKLSREADNINMHYNQRQIEELYRSFKDDNSSFRNVKMKAKCDPVKITDHFKQHFNPNRTDEPPIELHEAPMFLENLKKINIEGINTSSPSKKELKDIMKKLKGGKSSNDVPIEFLKAAVERDEITTELERIYKSVWETKCIPSAWRHSKLITIWKGSSKGSSTDPTAYRGIQIGSTLCKIMIAIILKRLNSWYNKQLSDHQQGFRTGRGTADGIFAIKRLQQITKKMGISAYLLFVDLTAAFDTINRQWLFQTIYQRLPAESNKDLFKLLESIYKYTTTALAEDPDNIFEITSGVRQGGPESPCLYNLYMDYVMRIFIENAKKAGVKFIKLKYSIDSRATVPKPQLGLGNYGDFIFDWIGYADDVVLAFASIESLKNGLNILNETFRRFHLTINCSKTKSMILNHHGENYPETIASLNDFAIENIKTFLYLGSQIHYNQPTTGDEELNLRVDSAESKFYSLGKKFMNHKIKLTTRVKIFNALVRSRLTYGCQTWVLNNQQSERIRACYTTMLRKMIRGGFKRKPDEFSYIMTNAKILQLCKTTALNVFMDTQRRAYLAHVIRSDDISILKKLLFNNDQARVPGRYLCHWNSVLTRTGCSKHEFVQRAIDRKY